MTITTTCINANLDLLWQRLSNMLVAVEDAADELRAGNRNLAIGTLLPLEQDLNLVTALYRTILTLHQMPSIDDTARTKGGAQ